LPTTYQCHPIIYGIGEVGTLDNFAGYTLKRIKHESDGQFDLNPQNTVVVCSTTVVAMYEALGFRVLPAELADQPRSVSPLNCLGTWWNALRKTKVTGWPTSIS